MTMASRQASTRHERSNRSIEGRTGLDFRVAATVKEVECAWRLVHDSYVRIGLIEANNHRIHTVRHAVHPDTAVIIGREPAGVIVSTMSSYLDRPGGLPLDAVYAAELDAKREQGCRLMEVGLFADRREKITRSLPALMELMRYTFFYAIHRNVTDVVIGVHPHHAGFYQRLFGFQRFAEDAGCPAVNGSPMVPMVLPIHVNLKLDPLPKGLAYFSENPLKAKAFERRLLLSAEEIAATSIHWYLTEQYRCGARR